MKKYYVARKDAMGQTVYFKDDAFGMIGWVLNKIDAKQLTLKEIKKIPLPKSIYTLPV